MFCFHSFQGRNLVQLHRAARRLRETRQIAADRPPRGSWGGGAPARSCPPSLKTRGRSRRSDTQRGRGVRQAEAGEVRQKMKDENGRKTWAEGRMKAETNSKGPPCRSSSPPLIGCRHFITPGGELISVCLRAIIAKISFGFAWSLLEKLAAC